MTSIIGVDIGTSSCKCAIYDTVRSELVALASKGYPLETPEPGRVELDPELVLEKTLWVIQKAVMQASPLGDTVSAIGIAGAAHSLLAVDTKGKPLTRCITNLDTRAVSETVWLQEEIGSDAIYSITSQTPLEKYPVPKILWMRNHYPEIFKSTAQFLLLKDYVINNLTGEFTTDHTSAAQYLLYDHQIGDWSDLLLERLGFDRNKFPLVKPATSLVGSLHKNIALRLGLPLGTPVNAGVIDTFAAALGIDASRPGRLFETTGTSTALVAYHNRLPIDPSHRVELTRLCPSVYSASIILHGTGATLDWVQELLGFFVGSRPKKSNFKEMEVAASMIPPGSDNLLFLPYLGGGGRLLPNANFPGVIFGLRLAHKKAHLFRAVLEGVAYSLQISLDVLKETGVHCREVRVAGGGAQNRLWRQIKADVLKIPVIQPSVLQPATLGAGLIAGKAVGIYDDLFVASESYIKSVDRCEPNLDNQQTYDRLIQVFKKLPHSLEKAFLSFSETP